MSVRRQHFVPQVYLKNWETAMSDKNGRRQYSGIYYYEKNKLEKGVSRNKDSILWEPRLYNVDYELSFMMRSYPEIEKDFIKQLKSKLDSRGVNAYYKGNSLIGDQALKIKFLHLEEWEFRYKKHPMNIASKKAIVNEIKSINSEVLEDALSRLIENNWDSTVHKFIDEMENTIPINGINEYRRIDENTVLDIVKLIFTLIGRNPKFDFLGILPKSVDILSCMMKEFDDGISYHVDKSLKLCHKSVWLGELYNAVFDVPKGYFHNMKTLAESDLQIILFKTGENQGRFITSDMPAFIHSSLAEETNMNGIYFPLSPNYLVMIGKGKKNSLREVNFRLANNLLIKKINMMILNNSNNAIVSDSKYLGYIL